MKKTAFIFLALSMLACGMQAQTPTSAPAVNTESSDVQIPAQMLADPTEKAAPIYFTTAPLNVRACASIDCEKLADLPINTQVTVFILDLQGPGCEGGEWYAIDAPKSGYVCSLYVEER
jgi:hypothetical protein